MLRNLLGLDDAQQIEGVDVHLNGGWITALILVAAAVALVIYLYISEKRLTGGLRTAMAVCKGTALLLLIVIILEPVADVKLIEPDRRTVLVLVDSSRSMAIADHRATPAEVGDAAKVLGQLPREEQLRGGSDVDVLKKKIGDPTRFDLAKAALTDASADFLEKLGKTYDVQFFSFDDALRSEGQQDDPLGWVKDRVAQGRGSLVGSWLDKAVRDNEGRNIAGVVMLSDFAWGQGDHPVTVASRLQKKGVRVYPVPIGLAKPADIRVRKVIGPEIVFKEAKIPLRVRVESNGFGGQTVDVELHVDGERHSTQEITLEGGVQFTEFELLSQKASGNLQIEVKIPALADETSDKNNSATHKVQIISQKIKVLYIEGMPRWEYRYLRRVLLKDARLDVKFLMTQGDQALAATSNRHLATFPQVAKDAFRYDLIILGDVPASYFNATQLSLMENLVKKRGGSLLMIAGPVGAPVSYQGNAIGRMLPVKIKRGQWQSVNAGPQVTTEGAKSPMTSLVPAADRNARIWANVSPMYLPPLDGAKPGATVLLSKRKGAGQINAYPIISWQRFGTGKAMFVATEDLWRLRLEVGDKYHAHFWGQAIEFLALSRLLGKNKQISIETDRRSYSAGEKVRVFANVLTPTFEPVEEPSYPVLVRGKEGVEFNKDIELSPVAGSPGLYSAMFLAGNDGSYEITTRAANQAASNRAKFEVTTKQMEDRETAMQIDVARQMAAKSGGKSLSLVDLATLPEAMGKEEPIFVRKRREFPLWDTPILFILVVLFAGIEWFLRRRHNLV